MECAQCGTQSLAAGPPRAVSGRDLAHLAGDDREASGVEIGTECHLGLRVPVPRGFDDGPVIAGDLEGTGQPGFAPGGMDDDIAVITGVLGSERSQAQAGQEARRSGLVSMISRRSSGRCEANRAVAAPIMPPPMIATRSP